MLLPITTPIGNPSKYYRHFRMAVACAFRKSEQCRHCRYRAGSFENFRSGFRFWHICHVDCNGHFTLKQLRLSPVNEIHTKPNTGPRPVSPPRALMFYGGYIHVGYNEKIISRHRIQDSRCTNTLI